MADDVAVVIVTEHVENIVSTAEGTIIIIRLEMASVCLKLTRQENESSFNREPPEEVDGRMGETYN